MKVIEKILLELSNRHETLAVAESCTGGGLAHEITSTSGVSGVFLGGLITYRNSAKINLLHVPEAEITEHGAVSQQVALLMAKNCRQIFDATWALSTTGIAGPTGGSKEKPVGLVWIGVAGPHTLFAKDFLFGNATRLVHRQKTIEHAFLMLKDACSL